MHFSTFSQPKRAENRSQINENKLAEWRRLFWFLVKYQAGTCHSVVTRKNTVQHPHVCHHTPPNHGYKTKKHINTFFKTYPPDRLQSILRFLSITRYLKKNLKALHSDLKWQQKI